MSGRWSPINDAADVLDRIFKRDKDGKFAETGGGGSGPGSGVDQIAAGKAEELANAAFEAAGQELPGRRLYRGGKAPGIGPHGDEALHTIVAQQGFDGPARVVSRREMDKAVRGRDGDVEMFRGVEGGERANGKTADQVHEQIRSGEDYQGLGSFGNGTYFSNSHGVAAGYGQVGRYALDRKAKIADYDKLLDEQQTFLRSVGRESVTGQVFSDPGRYAAARGYDAIHVDRRESGNGQEYVVLNRTALIAEA